MCYNKKVRRRTPETEPGMKYRRKKNSMIRKKASTSGSDRNLDFNTTWSTAAGELRLVPMDKSGGFSVRPGIYELRGSMALRGGVNFTVHSAGATAVTLVLFHREEDEPYARILSPSITGSATCGR